jgi:hypothetical protein
MIMNVAFPLDNWTEHEGGHDGDPFYEDPPPSSTGDTTGDTTRRKRVLGRQIYRHGAHLHGIRDASFGLVRERKRERESDDVMMCGVVCVVSCVYRVIIISNTVCLSLFRPSPSPGHFVAFSRTFHRPPSGKNVCVCLPPVVYTKVGPCFTT